MPTTTLIEPLFDFGLRRAPNLWRCTTWFLKFRCGCSGDITEGLAPNITLRCGEHYRTDFRGAA